MKQIPISLLLVFLLTGCAGKQRFGYPISPVPSSSVASRKVELLSISDVRKNRAIDGSFTTNLLEDVRGVVAWELAGTGQFNLQASPAPNPALNPAAEAPSGAESGASHGGRGAAQSSPRKESTPDPGGKMPPSTAGGTPATTEEKRSPAELRLKTELKRLEWEVPNYNSIIGNTFLLSLFTGGIGGGIYISTSTSVNGFAVLDGTGGNPIAEIRNPKSEARKKSEDRSPKAVRQRLRAGLRMVASREGASLKVATRFPGFASLPAQRHSRISDFFRASDFGLRISLKPPFLGKQRGAAFSVRTRSGTGLRRHPSSTPAAPCCTLCQRITHEPPGPMDCRAIRLGGETPPSSGRRSRCLAA